MTDKITLTLTLDELKELDKNLYYCEETWSIFDKIKVVYPQPKMTLANSGEFAVVSYNYKLYYRFEYPDSGNFSWYKTQDVPKGYVTGVFEPVTDAETERLLEGLYYNHIVVKKETAQESEEQVSFVPKEIKELVKEGVKWCEEHPDKDPLDWLKPQTPEETEQSLKEAFREVQQTEKWKELQRKIDAPAEGIYDNIDIDKLLKKWEENPPEFLKFELGKTLEDICMRWWDDIFTINSSWDSITSIQDFCDRVELWLPREQDASGSQDIYAVAAVEGFNDAIKKIKSKLRNKKV